MNIRFKAPTLGSRTPWKVTALAGSLALALAAFSTAASADENYSTYNAAGYSVTLPANATAITVTVRGGSGGGGGSDLSGNGGNGGNSATLTATIAVQGGEQVTAFVGEGGKGGARYANSSGTNTGGAGIGGNGQGAGGAGGAAGSYGISQYSGAGAGGGGASYVSVGGAYVRSGGGGGGGGGSWNSPGNGAVNNAANWTTDLAACGTPGIGAAGTTATANGGGGGGGGGGYTGDVGSGGQDGRDNGRASEGGKGGGSCVLKQGSYLLSDVSSTVNTTFGGGGGGQTATNGLSGSDGEVTIAIKLGPPTVTVNCTPSPLSTAGAVATCTVTSNVPAPTGGLPVTVTPPASNTGYSTTCANPMTIPAGQQTATCEIKAASKLPDTATTATLSIQPNGTNYIVGNPGSASVALGVFQHVPVNAPWALAGLGALMALLGLRRARRSQS